MDDGEDLADCWRTLREIPTAQEVTRNNTVSMAVALKRITRAIKDFCQVTHVFEAEALSKMGVAFVPDPDPNSKDGWAAVLTDPPTVLKELSQPDYREGVNEGLHVLFTRLHDAILAHLLEVREEASHLKKEAGRLDTTSYQLERIRQRLGGFAPEQCSLPFPSTEPGVNVESYIHDGLFIDPADAVEGPHEPSQELLNDLREQARNKRAQSRETEAVRTFADGMDDDIPF